MQQSETPKHAAYQAHGSCTADAGIRRLRSDSESRGVLLLQRATEPPLPSAGTHLAALGHVSPELMQDHSRFC